jgi:hypothetical protein
MVVTRKRAAGYVLRCFDCPWSATAADWPEALKLEGEHAKPAVDAASREVDGR